MREMMGEYCLLVAMVEISVRDWLSDRPLEDEIMPADYYLFGDERVEPFSFKWICIHLSLDYRVVRAGLKEFGRLNKEEFQENKNHYSSNRAVNDHVFGRYLSTPPSVIGQDLYTC